MSLSIPLSSFFSALTGKKAASPMPEPTDSIGNISAKMAVMNFWREKGFVLPEFSDIEPDMIIAASVTLRDYIEDVTDRLSQLVNVDVIAPALRNPYHADHQKVGGLLMILTDRIKMESLLYAAASAPSL